MLYIICLVHLGDDLARGGEFSVRSPYFGFTVTGSHRRRKSRRGCHSDLLDDTAGKDPGPHILEGPREVTDIIGQLPRRVDMLPMQDILLDSKNQQEVLQYRKRLTHMIELTDGLPAHHRDEIPGYMVGSSREMGLDSHQVVGYCAGDGGLHDGRQKLVRRAMVVGRPRHLPVIMGKTQALAVAHGPPMPPVVAPA